MAASPREPRIPEARLQAANRPPAQTSFDCTPPFPPWAQVEETRMARSRLFLREDVTTFKGLSPSSVSLSPKRVLKRILIQHIFARPQFKQARTTGPERQK